MCATKMPKFYAIVIGREPGVYTDWPTAQKQVSGFKGAIFKSFATREQADAFIAASTAQSGTTHDFNDAPQAQRTLIYSDGSFKDKACGFGIVAIMSDGTKHTAYGRVPLAPTNNVAELYAIYAALSLFPGDMLIRTDSSYSIACLTSYIHDWLKVGFQGVANADLLKATYSLLQNRKVEFQHVPAHVGIPLNEEVDRLANDGRLSTYNLIYDGVPQPQ